MLKYQLLEIIDKPVFIMIAILEFPIIQVEMVTLGVMIVHQNSFARRRIIQNQAVFDSIRKPFRIIHRPNRLLEDVPSFDELLEMIEQDC